MLETLLQPFQFSFMTHAFWIMAIVSIPTSLLSCYLVLKGWSLMGDAISHAVLPGVFVEYSVDNRGILRWHALCFGNWFSQ